MGQKCRGERKYDTQQKARPDSNPGHCRKALAYLVSYQGAPMKLNFLISN